MLPDANHQVWGKIVAGEKSVQTGNATVNLLIKSLKMSYGLDRSPANQNQLIAKLHSFFSRYESTLASEIAQIFL